MSCTLRRSRHTLKQHLFQPTSKIIAVTLQRDNVHTHANRVCACTCAYICTLIACGVCKSMCMCTLVPDCCVAIGVHVQLVCVRICVHDVCMCVHITCSQTMRAVEAMRAMRSQMHSQLQELRKRPRSIDIDIPCQELDPSLLASCTSLRLRLLVVPMFLELNPPGFGINFAVQQFPSS